MDGYFFLDELARLKFYAFHMLLEICKYISNFHFLGSLSGGVPYDLLKFLGTLLCGSLLAPHFTFIEIESFWHIAAEFDVIAMAMTYVLFQLPTILSILSPLPIMGTTPLVKSPISFFVFFKRSNRAASCH